MKNHPDTLPSTREVKMAHLQPGDTIALRTAVATEWALVLHVQERPLTQVDVTILRTDFGWNLNEETYTTSNSTVARIA